VAVIAVLSVAMLTAQIVGSVSSYTVRSGDSLSSVGARHGVSSGTLAAANGLQSQARLRVGQVLTIDSRHIVPDVEDMNLVVNVPQRMLFWVSPRRSVRGFPIAAGRKDWKTPLGDFTIVSRETDPTWDVPKSIQEEMRREGKPVLTHVPPSPENPLGKYWMGLSIPGVGIHGTNAPSSIYSLVTHGCIRLHPEDIAQLFPEVKVGMHGRIIYEPVLIVLMERTVFLEVNPDTYKNVDDPIAVVRNRALAGGFLDMIDLALVRDAVERREGIVRDVTRR
jgi:L,D-transpeptidase ErfK/SrfK